MSRRRSDPASHRAARVLARRAGGEAGGPRLLGARRPARVAELGGVRARAAVVRGTILLLDEGEAPFLGRSTWCAGQCGARLRARDGRAAARASRAICRLVRRHADLVTTRSVAQPVYQRSDRRLRGAPAAPACRRRTRRAGEGRTRSRRHIGQRSRWLRGRVEGRLGRVTHAPTAAYEPTSWSVVVTGGASHRSATPARNAWNSGSARSAPRTSSLSSETT